MPVQVVMPQLGESVVEGTVGRWLVNAGDRVREYDSILIVATDKLETEIPSPATGVLARVLVPEGQTVPSGTLLAEIVPDESAGALHDAHAGTGTIDEAFVSGPLAGHGPNHSEISATPLAQRLARDHGIDLTQVRGSGKEGRITREDVQVFLAAGEAKTTPAPAPPVAPTPTGRRPLGFISPAVARMAAEFGVDLAEVIGTGEGGRISKKDVQAYISAPVPRSGPIGVRGPTALPGSSGSAAEQLAPWETPGTGSLFRPTEEQASLAPEHGTGADESDLVPLSAMRQAIARHMVQSVQTAPHATTIMEADLTRVLKARERLKPEFERQGVRLTLTPFFVQAIVAGLRAVPQANSSFTEKGLKVHRRIHVGIAVALPDGLLVPVVRNADEKSLLGLAKAVNDLVERARTKQVAPDELQGGTFTLTNHGTSGSLFATPIISQPQAGILGVGAVRKRVIVVTRGDPLLPDADDSLAIRPMAYLSFSFDHRVLDGGGADTFLATVVCTIESYEG